MDLFLLCGIATSLLILFLTLYFWSGRGGNQTKDQQKRVPVRAQENIPRRAQIARNQRNRLRGIQQSVAEPSEDDETADERSIPAPPDEKVGAKKRAKLEAKAEKKAHREVEIKIREEKKKKAAVLEEERKKQEQKEEDEDRKRLEAERHALEEKERKEHEEYIKLKETFSIEEEGYDEINDEEKQNLLQEFVKYIVGSKIVVLEDLAIHFKLKTQEIIDRIAVLQADGTLTGVIDDRGKFIYISPDELEAVAKFIKQRGRVSITELAESSNKLINLSAVTSQ